MNRENSTGKKTKLRVKLTLTALVLISIILSACPPLEEDPYDNTFVYAGPLDSETWMDILNEIHERGVPVNLDLSGCIVPKYQPDVLKPGDNEWEDYTQFDLIPGFPYGKKYILSLILPKAATMIKDATKTDITLLNEKDKNKSAFRHFTNLRSITGENIEIIGNYAFIDCKTLEEVKFSKAVRIMEYAFYGCTGLKKVDFEVAKDIHISAFENCTNLEKAILPDAGTISKRAFKNCRMLTEVNFDVATKIGEEAFRNCTGLKIARFRADPVRTSGGHPLQPYLDGKPRPFVNDSVVFYNSAFRGCKSLEVLDIRYAWNVYFAGGALADIGEHLELFLFDDNGTKSYGHPQTDMYFGDIEESEENGGLTLKTLLIRAPVITPFPDPQIKYYSQIEKYYSPDSLDAVKTGIYHDIRGRYSYDSGETVEEDEEGEEESEEGEEGEEGEEEGEKGEPKLSCYIDVTILRGPAL